MRYVYREGGHAELFDAGSDAEAVRYARELVEREAKLCHATGLGAPTVTAHVTHDDGAAPWEVTVSASTGLDTGELTFGRPYGRPARGDH